MPTVIDNGSTYPDLSATAELSPVQHGNERDEKGSNQTRVKAAMVKCEIGCDCEEQQDHGSHEGDGRDSVKASVENAHKRWGGGRVLTTIFERDCCHSALELVDVGHVLIGRRCGGTGGDVSCMASPNL